MRHFVIVGILVLLAAVGTYVGLDASGLMPVAASAQAGSAAIVGSIDWMWNLQVIAMSFLFALIVVPLLYSLIVFRRKKGDTSDAEHVEGNTNLEIAWTIVPLFIVVVFAYLGAFSLREVRRVDPEAMVVKVHARQFSWSFEYPEYGGFITDKLYLPEGKQVLLQMDSTDVIHSFWVPEFRVKQDVVPGRVTELRITPTLPGEYKVRCAELCGSAHYKMEQAVVVTGDAEFVAWVAEQQAAYAAAQTPEGKGQLLAQANGCLACHSVTSTATPTAPTWFGLFGSTVTLEDGSTVVADEAFIHESIVDPMAKIVKGYQPTMPATYGTLLSEEDIANIIAYIMTLK